MKKKTQHGNKNCSPYKIYRHFLWKTSSQTKKLFAFNLREAQFTETGQKNNKFFLKKRFSCPFLPSWSMGLGFGSHNTRLFHFLQCLLLIKKLLMKEATKAAGWTNGLSYILNILVSSVFPSKGCGIPKLWIINYKIIKHKWSKGGRSWKCTWSRQTVAIVREEILRVTYTLIN